MACALDRNVRFGKVGALGVEEAFDDEPLNTCPLLEVTIPITKIKTIQTEKKKKKICIDFSSE